MRRRLWLVAALMLLPGCETVNDSVVRIWFQDQALGRRVHTQIRNGLEKREAAPPVQGEKRPAPPFLDEG